MVQENPSFSNCFTAQTSPNVLGNGLMNPDVGGFGVGISNIVINVCLSILLMWSKPSEQVGLKIHPPATDTLASNQNHSGVNPGVSAQTLLVNSDVDSKSHAQGVSRSSVYGNDFLNSVYGLFSQVYPILLATAACIGGQHLTLFEAHFAVAVSASPISVYLSWMAAHTAFHTPKLLFHVARHTRTAAALWLGLFLPLVWLTLNLIVSFSDRAFTNSYLCRGMNIRHWLEFQVVSNFIGVLDVMGRRDLWSDLQGRGGLGAVSVAALWVWGVYFVHHRDVIFDGVRAATKKYSNLPPWRRWPLRIWASVKAPWDVIVGSHPWLLVVIICCLHWSWILGIVRGISLNQYHFTYGQALSLFSAIPSLVATLKLVAARRSEIFKFFVNLPPNALEEVTFIFVGKAIIPHPDRRQDLLRMCLRALLALALTTSLAIYIWHYAISGSVPNPRTVINNPHENWKAFSIGVYISGFLIGSINIWFWSHYRARVTNWLNSVQSHRTRILLLSLHWLIFFPIAMFMCVAPLFSPFAALPLSQEKEWDHRCDTFAGEAILEGRSYVFQAPRVSLHYMRRGSSGVVEYEYIINKTDDANIWSFDLENTSFNQSIDGLRPFYPLVRSIVYNLNKSTMSATCMTIGSSTPFPCMWGHFDRDNYFSIFLNDTRSITETKLRAADREWYYSDDAPSFTLNKLGSDGHPDGMVMQSAVTKRSHCELLKVCLSDAPGLNTLTPLGLVLWAQDRYATYCTTPRLYG